MRDDLGLNTCFYFSDHRDDKHFEDLGAVPILRQQEKGS